jgi:hypothetical protein
MKGKGTLGRPVRSRMKGDYIRDGKGRLEPNSELKHKL